MWRAFLFLWGLCTLLAAGAALRSGAYVTDAATDYLLATQTDTEQQRMALVLIDPHTGATDTLHTFDVAPQTTVLADGSTYDMAQNTIAALLIAPNQRAAILSVSSELADPAQYYFDARYVYYYLDFDRRTISTIPALKAISYYSTPTMNWAADSRSLFVTMSPPDYNDYSRQEIFQIDAIDLEMDQLTTLKDSLYLYGWLDDEHALILQNNYSYGMWTVNANTQDVDEYDEADFYYEELAWYDAPNLPNGIYTLLASPPPAQPATTPDQPTPSTPIPSSAYVDDAIFYSPDYDYLVELNYTDRATIFYVQTPSGDFLSATETGELTILGWMTGGYRLLMYRASTSSERGLIFVYDLEADSLTLVADVPRNSTGFDYDGCVYRWEGVTAPGTFIPCNASATTTAVATTPPADPAPASAVTASAVTAETSFELGEGEIVVQDVQPEPDQIAPRRLVYRDAEGDRLIAEADTLHAIVKAAQPTTSRTPLLLGLALVALGSTRLFRKDPRWW